MSTFNLKRYDELKAEFLYTDFISVGVQIWPNTHVHPKS